MKVTMYSKRSEWLVRLTDILLFILPFLVIGVIIGLAIKGCVKVEDEPEPSIITRIESPFYILEEETTVVDDIEEDEDVEICTVPSLISEPIVSPEEETVEVETKVIEETEAEVEATRTYDIPLDVELQNYIISISDKYEVDHELIFAIIDVESKYDVDVIGDNGNAFGLMQIQPKWHSERMERLGVTSSEDLLDPYNNILVGVDFVAELIGYGRGVDWALMAYNGGPSNANARSAKVVNYYNKVMGTYEKLS